MSKLSGLLLDRLPNRYNVFTHMNYAIYSLDDYSVHLSQEVQDGITGDMQINDTDIQRPLKQELMIEKLRDNPAKIPTVGRRHHELDNSKLERIAC